MLNYRWKLSDGFKVASPALKCFGTFTGGGGSAMGYKLAGFDYLGGVEIDPSMAKVYKKNLNPKNLYMEDINRFNKRTDLPDELFDLDLLDGSPPCSSFSMAGSREDKWGEKKKFREGQKQQVLDDLVFSYVDTIKKLSPRAFILENVKAMSHGNAKSYCRRVVDRASDAGYIVQAFALNSNSMGVPQSRERLFIIGRRLDVQAKNLALSFNRAAIPFSSISDDADTEDGVTESERAYWLKAKEGDTVGKFDAVRKMTRKKPAYTLASSNRSYHFRYKRKINRKEMVSCGSFPLDYDFMGGGDNFVNYLIGMSVPPLMTAGIASEIAKQWFGVKYGEV